MGKNSGYGITRRGFLGSLGAGVVGATLEGCDSQFFERFPLPHGKTHYIMDGPPLAQPADGLILQSAAQHFDPFKWANIYSPEMADVFNETCARESIPVDENAYVVFIPPGTGNYGNFVLKRNYNFKTCRYDEERRIEIYDKLSVPLALGVLSHEAQHANGYHSEEAPMLAQYWIPTACCYDFPQFGIDSDCMTYGINHGDVLETIHWDRLSSGDAYSLAALSALLAINESEGSFPVARDIIGGVYPVNFREITGRACNFVNAYVGREEMVDSMFVYNGQASRCSFPLREVALRTLHNVAAEYIIRRNIQENGSMSPADKDSINRIMRRHSQSVPVSYQGPDGPLLARVYNMYLDGFEFESILGIKMPSDYNNDIPKGTIKPMP